MPPLAKLAAAFVQIEESFSASPYQFTVRYRVVLLDTAPEVAVTVIV